MNTFYAIAVKKAAQMPRLVAFGVNFRLGDQWRIPRRDVRVCGQLLT